ncbi:MAG: hypothetical protein OEW12_05310 [Deltaproteobacteria bacterium]|nr:hypothetical protein [Deltaproteobacteria bacterium]
MILTQELYTQCAALLLVMVVRHHPIQAARLGHRGFWLVFIGVMLPLTDYVTAFLTTGNLVDLVGRDPVLHAPLYGLAALGAVGVVILFWNGMDAGRRVFIRIAAGYGLVLGLLFITPVGVPLWAPFDWRPVSLPIHYPAHPLLLLILVMVVAFLEAFPFYWRQLIRGTAVFFAGYLVMGLAVYGLVLYQTSTLNLPGGRLDLEPANPFLTHWRVVQTRQNSYRLLDHQVLAPEHPVLVEAKPRWEDLPETLTLLRDPVVYRFYRLRFTHPLIRMEKEEDKTTLVMEELVNPSWNKMGRVFVFQTEGEGKDRDYQVQRFLWDFPTLAAFGE